MSALSVGPIAVQFSHAEAAAMAEAVLPEVEGSMVAMIQPIAWLALPEIRDGLAALADPSRFLLLHESQSFDAVAPLEPATRYVLMAGMTVREGNPARLEVVGRVTDASGNEVARLRAGLVRLPCGAERAA
jgi:hypothetical protein